MEQSPWAEYYTNDIPRADIERVARRLKQELDEIHTECQVQYNAGQDYTALWARSGGVFMAYKSLCDILGWQ